jgi:aspartokinase/homoserine dehydrogenase 1
MPKQLQKPLRVLKFGGTSVGNASAIARVAEIIRAARHEAEVVVVVSAMRGVTNKLIDAGSRAAAGMHDPGAAISVAAIFEDLRQQHHAAIDCLIHSTARRSRVTGEIDKLLRDGEQLCRITMQSGELTPGARDAISSLGERLSAPLLAAVLVDYGLASEAIAATELIQTDCCHGAAEPDVEATRIKCETALRPLLQRGVIPVVTGYIGATAEGVLTTLGRGGSDYSATILASAIAADEVTIWTDVDGMMTADPRLVPDAFTIAEISYQEAAEMAHFGAKVLHPKTLAPLTECGIPLWIRNTFAPERTGTCITPHGPTGAAGVKGITSLHLNAELSLLSLIGTRLAMTQITAALLDVLARAKVNVLGVERASEERISFSMKKSDLNLALETLHRELRLGELEAPAFPAQSVGVDAAFWERPAEPRTANAD